MRDDFPSQLAAARQGDTVALARALSLAEKQGAALFKHSDVLSPPKMALRIGITGPPGAGKSTLTGKLIAHARAQGLKVAVIAVDPSSPFTKGAILADRVRYSEHSLDPQVFIRSLGTRGSLGGLSASAYLMARVFDVCGFDLLLIETVGVGQTELEIINVADRVAVTLVPESGDSIQAMKAGLLEIADLFVINKADRPGAANIVTELQNSMALAGEKIEVFQTVASQGTGVDELAKRLFSPMTAEEKSERTAPWRLQAEAKALLRAEYEAMLEEKVRGVGDSKDLADLLS